MVETAQTVADWQISFPKWGVFVRAVALGVLSRMSLIGEGLSLGAGGTSRELVSNRCACAYTYPDSQWPGRRATAKYFLKNVLLHTTFRLRQPNW